MIAQKQVTIRELCWFNSQVTENIAEFWTNPKMCFLSSPYGLHQHSRFFICLLIWFPKFIYRVTYPSLLDFISLICSPWLRSILGWTFKYSLVFRKSDPFLPVLYPNWRGSSCLRRCAHHNKEGSTTKPRTMENAPSYHLRSFTSSRQHMSDCGSRVS